MRTFTVYIMASRSRVLYIGVTNDLARRVNEHQQGLVAGFTSRYRITRLVYFEEFADIRDAIAREKEIKGWVRSRKTRLIESRNPTWEDLSFLLFPNERRSVVILSAAGAKDLLFDESRSFATRALRRAPLRMTCALAFVKKK